MSASLPAASRAPLARLVPVPTGLRGGMPAISYLTEFQFAKILPPLTGPTLKLDEVFLSSQRGVCLTTLFILFSLGEVEPTLE